MARSVERTFRSAMREPFSMVATPSEETLAAMSAAMPDTASGEAELNLATSSETDILGNYLQIRALVSPCRAQVQRGT